MALKPGYFLRRLAPILFLNVDAYLESRLGKQLELSAEEQGEVEGLFFEHLDATHEAYGRCRTFDEMIGQLADNLTSAWGNPDQMRPIANLVRQHGQMIDERVESAMQTLEVNVEN